MLGRTLHLSVMALILGGLLLTSGAKAEPKALAVDYTHNMLINGQKAQATAKGVLDLENGKLYLLAKIDKYIPGYGKWPASAITKALSSIMPVGSLQLDGAKNLFSLTAGKLGYKIRSITKDEFADIVTEINVSIQKNTVVAVLNSTGTAKYPNLVGMGPERVIFTQKSVEGGFIETVTKSLVDDQGKFHATQVSNRFEGVNLPGTQLREVSVSLLAASKDLRDLTIVYQSVVRPQK